MTERLSPDAEREALKAMVQSEGWRIFMAHIDDRWGAAACEAALRDSVKSVTPEEWPFESRRILDAFAGMRADVRWPEARIRTLGDAKKPGPLDRFAGLHRRPVRA